MTKERAYEMIKSLLATEEKSDALNLTSKERRELQKITEEAFVEEPKQPCVQTPDGELYVEMDDDPNNPSISIMLNPKGTDATINVVFTEFSVGHGIRAVVFGDATSALYTHQESLKHLDEIKMRYKMGTQQEEEDEVER